MDSEIATIRLFKDEFTEEAWKEYCKILNINEETAERIISIELGISRILPQIN